MSSSYTISVRNFEPKTAKSQEEVDRKKELKRKIEETNSNLSEIRQTFHQSEKLAINVNFYLLGGTGVEGRTKKDLDNLLKIVCDVLPDYMDKEKNNRGLGLMKTDNSIYKIHCTKSIVNDPKDEGLDIEISEF